MIKMRKLLKDETAELAYALVLAAAKNQANAVECSLGELEAKDADALADYKAEREKYQAAAEIDQILAELAVGGRIVVLEEEGEGE